MNLKYVMRCGQPSDRFHSFVHTPSFLLFCAEEYMNLKYVMRCVNESMRLYPHPPVLLRRAMVEDELPGETSLDFVHHLCARSVCRFVHCMRGFKVPHGCPAICCLASLHPY